MADTPKKQIVSPVAVAAEMQNTGKPMKEVALKQLEEAGYANTDTAAARQDDDSATPSKSNKSNTSKKSK